MASRTLLRCGLAAAAVLGGCHLIGGAGELEFESLSGGGGGAGGGTGGSEGGGGASSAVCENGTFERGDVCFEADSPKKVATAVDLQDLVVSNCNGTGTTERALPDILVVGRVSFPGPSNLLLSAFPNEGGRTFGDAVELPVSSHANPLRMVGGRFTERGGDLAVALEGFSDADEPALHRFEGKAACTFAPLGTVETLPAEPKGLSTIAFDSDDRDDLVVTLAKPTTDDPEWWVLVGDMVKNGTAAHFIGEPSGVATGHFNDDGREDFAFIEQASNSVVWRLRSGEGFGLPTSVEAGDGARDVAVLDVDGDGIDDLVVANMEGNSLSILVGDGAGGFTKQAEEIFTVANDLGARPERLVVADINGDDLKDVVTLNRGVSLDEPSLGLFINDGAGRLQQAAGFPAAASAFIRGAAIADLDGDGAPDIVFMSGALDEGTTEVEVLWAEP